MADLAFELEYDGPALATHEMDVRELAPALISTADLFQELNRRLYPVAPPLAVNVRATDGGSFLVQLKIVYDSVINTLAADEATAGANLTAMLTVVGALMRYARRLLRSEQVSQSPHPTEPGVVVIGFADGTTLEIPEAVLSVRNNLYVQRSLSEIVQPVERPGVDIVRLRQEGITIGEVPKADVTAFEAPSGPLPRDTFPPEERTTYLTIHTAGFHTNRWRLWDGQSLVWAPISDESFIRRLDSGTLRVGKLDLLHCRIREERWRDQTGLHREVVVLEVLQVMPYDPDQQGSLDLPEE